MSDTLKWATVKAVDPFSIQLDGDSAPLLMVPDSLVDPYTLRIGNRVRVALSGLKVTVLGVAGGTGWTTTKFNGDMNTLIEPGSYMVTSSSATNTPAVTSGGIIQVFRSAGAYSGVRQIFRRNYWDGSATDSYAANLDTRVWERISVDFGATWSPWMLVQEGFRDWTNLTPAAGWSSSNLQYSVKNSMLSFKGEFWGGADMTAVFTVPVPPLSRLSQPVSRIVGTSVSLLGTLNIQTTGVATFVLNSGSIPSASPGISVGTISYRTA